MPKVLVVDDEANIRLLYAQELADEGYEVVTAGNAREAVERFGEHDLDLVVLDIKLRNESGLDLLQQIVRERNNVAVILCTAFSCYKDEFASWLADGYVVKSSDIRELKEEIRKVLEKRAQRAAMA